MDGPREPAVVVDGPVAEHLEVLGDVPILRRGIVEAVDHAHPVHRDLRRAVDLPGLGQAGGFEDGRRDIDHVVELGAQLALGLDALRPVDGHTDLGAAVVRRDLLGPLVGGVEGHRPAGGHVRVGLGPAPFVQLLEHVRDRLLHAVEVGHLAEHAVAAALGAGAVVAVDEDDQGVVELPGLLDGLDDPADLVVGHLDVGGEDLDLAGEQSASRPPTACPSPGSPRAWVRAPCPCGHDAPFDLARQDLVAQLVPALVELALPARDPLLRDVVRRVRGARREVDEEGPSGVSAFWYLIQATAWSVMSVRKW